jgi:hypothetical protein
LGTGIRPLDVAKPSVPNGHNGDDALALDSSRYTGNVDSDRRDIEFQILRPLAAIPARSALDILGMVLGPAAAVKMVERATAGCWDTGGDCVVVKGEAMKKGICVYYLVPCTGEIEWGRVVKAENRDSRKVLVFDDDKWEPAENCFFTDEQCRRYHRLPPKNWSEANRKIADKLERLAKTIRNAEK